MAATANGWHPPSQSSSQLPSPTSPTASIHSTAPRRVPSRSSLLGTTLVDPPPGMTYSDFLRGWSDFDIARWLSDNKCAHHADAFRDHDIRGDVLLELDQATLKEMGIASIGDRLRLVNAVKVLRQRCSSRALTPDAGRPKVTLSTELNGINGDSRTPAEQMLSPISRQRRLDIGRPTPLQLHSNMKPSDLPRLVRDSAPDSARSTRTMNSSSQTPGTSGTPYTATSSQSTSSSARTIPPLPPAPRGQPPLPPAVRTPARSASGLSTPGRAPPTEYLNQPLPPPPLPTVQTPNTASGSQTPGWSGQNYGLPADPRPGKNLRSTSPLPNGPPPRGSSRSPNPMHIRNSSSSSITGAVTTKPALTARPSTGGTSSNLALPPTLAHNLSPIAESFASTPTTSTPSPPNPNAYTVGRGPFAKVHSSHVSTPSLDDLRRKLVKFELEGGAQQTTINVADCAGGIEVLEKALKKFGKLTRSEADKIMDHVSTEEGGLTLDGWGVYLDWGLRANYAIPMTEAELMAVCHAGPNDPARVHGLTLRRSKSKPLPGIQGDSQSPTSPHFDVDPSFLSSGRDSAMNMKRASSISVLSGLGVRDPERALEPPVSPTTKSPLTPSFKKPSRLRNFFGQRPPSELITNHLYEYFPLTSRKVLERTRRNSMLHTSMLGPSGSLAADLNSRFSTSTLGSQGRASMSSHRGSYQPSTTDYGSQADFDRPRVSISTEDGEDIDVAVEEPEERSPEWEPEKPQFLPPVNLSSESLSQTMESLTGSSSDLRPGSSASRMSRMSKRMSYMHELRSKRDRSDTASLMTVDQITAEVENRRSSVTFTSEIPTVDPDDWTKVESAEADVPKDEDEEEPITEDVEVAEDSDTVNEEEEEEEEEEEAIKWIKGALIGAGAFGKVYLGMGASNGLLMAVKQVELPTGNSPSEERKKSMLTALEREIDLLKNLKHENIVQYLTCSTDEHFLNIFLEYVPGGSITALLRNYGSFEEPLVKNFVKQILQGLKYLHDKDIIHRDIKGANILVDNKGSIKISDFGISKKAGDGLLVGPASRGNRTSLQGSVFWMAPEVVKQTAYTLKADIWSVGCLVVEMFTGEHPWAQLTQMQAIFKIGSSSARPPNPPDISSEAEAFLDRTFDLNHDKRPSADELLADPWVAVKPKAEKKGGSKGASAAAAASSSAAIEPAS